MSALRIITGMTADEFTAPGAPPAARHARPPGEPVGHAQPCRAGMELCDKRRAVQPWGAGGDAARGGVPAGVSGDVASRAPPGMPARGTYDA
jgi:hypothetical protein